MANPFKGSGVLDEDNMVSDSDEAVPTQQSVKAFVTSNLGPNAMPKSFSVTDFFNAGGTAYNQLPTYSDDPTYFPWASIGGSFGRNATGFDAYEAETDTNVWADSDAIGGIIKLGAYIYVHMWDSGGTENRVYRFAKDDLLAGGTQMTIVTTAFGANAITYMISDGTDF